MMMMMMMRMTMMIVMMINTCSSSVTPPWERMGAISDGESASQEQATMRYGQR
jgi:hypothetical protein